MKDPAVLFYTQDFITGTILMTDEQRGKYILLLCLQHQNGKLTERDMMKICGRKDEDIWAKFHQENGCFYNKRMLLESEKRTKFCNHQKENINKRWNKKEYHGNTTVLPLENENENEDVIINEDKNIIKREVKFKSEVFEFTEKYSDVMLDKFVSYWTEKNKSGTKMRYELEKTFEVARRLATWASRDYDNNKVIKNDDLEYKQLKEKLYGKQPV